MGAKRNASRTHDDERVIPRSAKRYAGAAVLLAAWVLGSGPSAMPAAAVPAPDDEPLARITQILIKGATRDSATASEVNVTRGPGFVPATVPLSLFADDEVRTGADVSLTLLMLEAAAEQDNTVVIGPGSQFSVRGKRSIFLALGRLLASVRGLFDVSTRRANLGAKSTEFEVTVSEDDTQLLVLDGIVDVQQPSAAPLALGVTPRWSQPAGFRPVQVGFTRAGLFGPMQQAQAATQRWRVDVQGRGRASTRQSLTIANRCEQKHLYDVEGPETLPWFHLFAADRIEVGPGERRTVSIEIQVDASAIKDGTYQAEGTIKCLDCFAEPGCAQARESWPIQIRVGSSGGLTVRPLEEVRITRFDAGIRPAATTEERVRSAVDWSTSVFIAGSPSYSARRVLPHFRTADERAGAFKEARFAAVWRQDPAAYETVADVYTDWGRGAKAVEAYGKVLRQRARVSDAGLLASVAEAYRLKGQLDQAEKYSSQALSTSGDDFRAFNTLGNIYLDRADTQDDPQRARELLEKAGSAYRRAVETTPAERAAPRGVPRANIGDVHLALGDLAREQNQSAAAQGEYVSANDSFSAASDIYPDYAFARVGAGEAYRRIGEVAESQRDTSRSRDAFTRAESLFKAGLRAHPDLAAAHVGLGDLFIDQGRRQEAVQSYARAITVRPVEPSGYYRLGVVLQKDDPRVASRYLQTYLHLQGDNQKDAKNAKRATQMLRAGLVETTVTVPSLIKLQDQAARDALSRSSLKVGTVSSRPAAGVPQGLVIDQRPAAGTAVAPGTAVDFVVAGGGGGEADDIPLVVPDVVNRAVADATSMIERAGFTVGSIERKKSDRPADTVLKQSPGAGSRARRGTAVALEVAVREVKMVSVPDVVGDTRARAFRKLQDKGLRPGDIREEGGCEQDKVLSQMPAKNARVPADTPVALVVSGAGESAALVPSVIGLSQESAEQAIRSSRLQLRKVNRRESDQQAPSTVLDQKPDPNTRLAPGCPVDIVVAAPVPTIEVPNFVGLSEAQARQQLPGGLGGMLAPLRLGQVTYQEAGEQAYPGADVRMSRRQITTPTVVAQNPAANSRVRRGTQVDLVVVRPGGGQSQDTVRVPGTVGMTLDDARRAITAAGLNPGAVSMNETARAADGTVVSQSLQAGASVARGSRIDLVIARRSNLRTVPGLIGMDQNEAKAAISRAGLAVGSVTYQSTRDKPGTVIRQSPAGGTQVQAGTPVNLVVAMPYIG